MASTNSSVPSAASPGMHSRSSSTTSVNVVSTSIAAVTMVTDGKNTMFLTMTPDAPMENRASAWSYVSVGRSGPRPTPMIEMPCSSASIRAVALKSSAWPGRTNITSACDAVQRPIAVSISSTGESG